MAVAGVVRVRVVVGLVASERVVCCMVWLVVFLLFVLLRFCCWLFRRYHVLFGPVVLGLCCLCCVVVQKDRGRWVLLSGPAPGLLARGARLAVSYWAGGE